jgi:hypothetical protein
LSFFFTKLSQHAAPMAILKNASFFSIFNSLHSGKRARYIGAAPTEMLRGTILLHISIRLGVHGAHTDSYWTKLDAAYTRFCLTARVSKTTEEENKEKSEQSIRPKQAENEKEDDSRPQSGRVVMFSVNALYQRPRSDRSMFASTASEGVDGEQERSQRSPIWMASTNTKKSRWITAGKGGRRAATGKDGQRAAAGKPSTEYPLGCLIGSRTGRLDPGMSSFLGTF